MRAPSCPDPIDSDADLDPVEPFPAHPLAGIFPMMPEPELLALSDDILLHGQRSPITLLDAQILDGRNRYWACLLAYVEPITCEFRGDDPLQFVLSANLHRRHLSESQRAMVAAKLANVTNGGARAGAGRPIQTTNPPLDAADDDIQSANLPTEFSNAKAAAALNVSERSVRSARAVLKDAQQTKAVESGRKTVSAAAKEIKDQAAKTTPNSIPCDSTGCTIPEHLVPLWNRAGEIFEIQKLISRAEHLVKAAQAHADDPLWSGVPLPGIADQLRHAHRNLDGAVPHAVCPTCHGHSRDQCLHCQGKGFLSRHAFDRTVPEGPKALRA